MKAQEQLTYYVVAQPDEWIEIAARLPRNSSLRKALARYGISNQQEWGEFNPKEYRLISDAAFAADIHIDIIPPSAEVNRL